MELNTFLGIFGMSFTSKCLYLSDTISLGENQSEESGSKHDLDQPSNNPVQIRKNKVSIRNNNDSHYKEVLQGLNQVPTPNHPGTIIVAGNSQAILTSKFYSL